MKIKGIIFLLVIVSLTACRENDPELHFLKTVSDKVVLKGYQNLHQQADAFYSEALNCNKPSINYSAQLENLRLSWKQTMGQWQTVQWVQFGPIKQDGREWSLQFWPDKKNLVGKKVKRLFKKQAVISDQQIETGGVIVQGLSALEYLLFDQTVETLATPEQRCLSAIPMTRKMLSTTQTLAADWKAYVAKNIRGIKKTSPDAEILSTQQGLSMVVNNLVVFFDGVADKKIASPFSLTKSRIKPNAYFLESWRSQHSRENIEYNLRLIKSLFSNGGLQDLLDHNKQSAVGEAVVTEINIMLQWLEENKTAPSFFAQLSTAEKEALVDVQVLYQSMARLKRILRNDLTAALNVQIGFNSNDGDS